MNSKLLKLASLVMKFATIETDKGTLTLGEEMTVGAEVFIEKEGEYVPAEDGEYLYEDKIIVVKEGKIESILEKEEEVFEEETVSTEALNQLKEDFAALSAKADTLLADFETLKADYATIKEEVDALKAEVEKPVEEPLEMKQQPKEEPKKGALKYFD